MKGIAEQDWLRFSTDVYVLQVRASEFIHHSGLVFPEKTYFSPVPKGLRD